MIVENIILMAGIVVSIAKNINLVAPKILSLIAQNIILVSGNTIWLADNVLVNFLSQVVHDRKIAESEKSDERGESNKEILNYEI